MKFSIRSASNDDVSVIQELAGEIWRKHYAGMISNEQIEYMLNKMYSPSSLKEQINEGHRFFICSDEDKPVGYFSYSEKSPQNYFLHKLYINTNRHHRGGGKQMLQYLESLLPSDSSIRLTVNRKNIQAINFYFRNGFVIEEVIDIDIDNGFFMRDFVMLKAVRS
jgi:diamine N-acetyltransferase